jgi:hypothetical protein
MDLLAREPNVHGTRNQKRPLCDDCFISGEATRFQLTSQNVIEVSEEMEYTLSAVGRVYRVGLTPSIAVERNA